jgi:hypothetical protein
MSRALPALLAAGALALGACSDTTSEEPEESTSSTTSSPTTSASPVEEETTAPGTQLGFGESATVDYTIRKQQTLLELTVRSARQGEIEDFAGFNLSTPYQRNANYYYVQVSAENVGDGRMDGVDVPLWGISGNNTLLPPVQFTSSFEKCPTEPTPRRFTEGKTHRTCLVFLSPDKGTLEGISYRPVESFEPIEWRGQVKAPVTRTKDKKRDKGRDNGRDRGTQSSER